MQLLRGSVVIAPLALLACGPSLKAAIESDMRFEHCYRVDDDPSSSLPTKRACWSEWTTRYTRGQARERVLYAKERIKVLDGALASKPSAPPAETTAVACPPPMNPYAPPPKLGPKPVEAIDTPVHACSDACTKGWRTCSNPCGAESGCVLACDDKFRVCMKGCL